MTFPTRRTLGVSGVAAVLLVAAMMALNDERGGTGATPAPRAAGGAVAPDDAPVADVRLEALQRTRPGIEGAQRNLFRFQARPEPPSPPPPTAPAELGVAPGGRGLGRFGRAGNSGPPPPPPIPVRFIGIVEAPTQKGRVVFFSDGRGNVFSGREGDIIEGRYRVLKVSPDAAELAYLDGRGRQTIRLSGQ